MSVENRAICASIAAYNNRPPPISVPRRQISLTLFLSILTTPLHLLTSLPSERIINVLGSCLLSNGCSVGRRGSVAS